MLLIPCPHCGPREESEFTYGGPSRRWPAPDPKGGTAEWHDALYQGHDPSESVAELWYHGSGCECWIEIRRDTVTHAIGPGGGDSGTKEGGSS